ncbi:MAG: sugar ABC transporter permease [Tyzzerella sp.]|nr:sugar ABC transporter permease [Tyzzerella sp.]
MKKKVNILRKLFPYVMVIPTMILLAVFVFYPLVNMVYLSFFDYNLIKEKTFCGLDNYYRIFFIQTDFRDAFLNTLIYMAGTTFFLLFLGLVFALWLQRDSKFNAIAQRLMFFPNICAGLAISLIFQWLMDDEGLFNMVLGFFDIAPLRWLNDSTTSLLSVMIVAIWKGIGYYALILLSSVKSIPTELIEAADLDDAGKIRTFFKITLPMLSPQLFFLLITLTINSFKVFDSVRLMTGGGPGNSSDVLVYWIYRYSMEYNKYGLACAGGTVLLVILLILTVVYFRVIGKKVHYQ